MGKRQFYLCLILAQQQVSIGTSLYFPQFLLYICLCAFGLVICCLVLDFLWLFGLGMERMFELAVGLCAGQRVATARPALTEFCEGKPQEVARGSPK